MKYITKRQLLITYIPAILILLTVAIASVKTQTNITFYIRDVAAITNVHPMVGVLSNLGIFLWCVAASVTLFAAFIVRHFEQLNIFKFLLSSSLLSTYLMLDDAFLIHEVLAVQYLGMHEKAVLFILGFATLVYLVSFRKIILLTNYKILIASFVFLAISILTDGILDPWFWSLGDWEYFIEDAAKWLGIVSWCSYFIQTSYLYIIESLA